MKPFVWNAFMNTEETKNGAYWERNMLALFLAKITNSHEGNDGTIPSSGWYRHPRDEGDVVVDAFGFPGGTDDEYWKNPKFSFHGWSRVISISNGIITFHVPDDFDLGDLPEIKPNWDGHTTKEKWELLMRICGCKIDEGE